MRVFKRYMILAGVFIAAMSMAASKTTAVAPKAAKSAKTTKMIKGRALIEYKLEILERASANRELAALTQLEHMRDLAQQATDLAEGGLTETYSTTKALYKQIGYLESESARLCGLAAANFDKATHNRKSVETLCSKLNKSEQQRSSRAYAISLKIQANEAMRMASIACERAAVAYDKADEPVLLAAASQTAAVWLEKLAVR
ncbi:MAG: hypothetical protein PF904_16110 [Kiritimatiellae bacterium]|nr:hypothetical protein [Kiritimatiellia bacterium]